MRSSRMVKIMVKIFLFNNCNDFIRDPNAQTKKLVNFLYYINTSFYLFSSGFGGFGGPQFGGSAANAAAGTQSFNSGGLG